MRNIGTQCDTIPKNFGQVLFQLQSLSIDNGEVHGLHPGPAQHASVPPHVATTRAKVIAIVSNHDDTGVDNDVKTPSDPRHTSARLPDLASPHMEDRKKTCR